MVKDKIKRFGVTVFLMLVSFSAGVVFTTLKSPGIYNSEIIRNQMKKEADEAAGKLMEDIVELTEKLADANNTILMQGNLIHKYENHDKIESKVTAIRQMNAQIFATADAEIHIEEESPVCFGTTNLQLGNMTMAKTQDDLEVRYYFALFGDKIKVENVNDERINISYSANSFLNDMPYDVIKRTTVESFGAKILNNYENDVIQVPIADQGRKMLSEAEDEYIRQLKATYQNSEIPVYVNNVKLTEWKESDKKVK